MVAQERVPETLLVRSDSQRSQHPTRPPLVHQMGAWPPTAGLFLTIRASVINACPAWHFTGSSFTVGI